MGKAKAYKVASGSCYDYKIIVSKIPETRPSPQEAITSGACCVIVRDPGRMSPKTTGEHMSKPLTEGKLV